MKTINARTYQFSHGRLPRGKGFWFFQDDLGQTFSINAGYGAAVAAAKKALGGQVITVCP